MAWSTAGEYPQATPCGFRGDGRRCTLVAVTRSQRRPERLALQVFRGTDARGEGVLTPKQLRGNSWVHLRRDVYADAKLEDDHRLRCRAAMLVLPTGTTLCGLSAALVHGVDHAADRGTEVHVYPPIGKRIGPHTGVRVHTGRLAPTDLMRVGDELWTSPVRTAWDLGRWLPARESVPVIDGLLAIDAVSEADLAAYSRSTFGQRGSRLAARAFSVADGRSQSRPESVLRVRLVRAGLPKPVVQLAIVLPNGITLHPDLAWEEYRVAAEYDGLWHGDADQFHRDRRRLNLLVASGWLVLHVTSQRMRTDFAGVAREIRAALESRGWQPRSR